MGWIDPGLVIGGLLGGFTMGLTGMGGGALLTPMLVLVFGVSPTAAVGSDLVTSLAVKPSRNTTCATVFMRPASSTPTTATSATAGCARRQSSTSNGETHWPDTLMRSSARPANQR